MKRKMVRVCFLWICAVLLSGKAAAAEWLVPVGEVIGIELFDGSVSVAAFDDALGQNARTAGLEIGDRIVSVDDYPVTCAKDVRYALERADGTVELEVEREGKQMELTVSPGITRDGPRLGVYLRQGITGMGTVTWYDPDSGRFGALGHGVNTASGELLVMNRGSVYEASVAGVQKGAVGAPGQLLGEVENKTAIGSLSKNTAQGIFGTVQKKWEEEALPVGAAHTGEAIIRSTVSEDEVQEYSVEILKIYPNADHSGRNMLLKVTDPELLETTGGIVQGMSGSPIIQDGKLVGAVTHVLVNDPTRGYGIFIENMLEVAG